MEILRRKCIIITTHIPIIAKHSKYEQRSYKNQAILK